MELVFSVLLSFYSLFCAVVCAIDNNSAAYAGAYGFIAGVSCVVSVLLLKEKEENG